MLYFIGLSSSCREENLFISVAFRDSINFSSRLGYKDSMFDSTLCYSAFGVAPGLISAKDRMRLWPPICLSGACNHIRGLYPRQPKNYTERCTNYMGATWGV